MPDKALPRLQRSLEALYRISPAPDVSGFLIEHDTDGRREQLLVEIHGGDMFLGLALAPEAIARLGDRWLADDNLDDFCLAVEGVSHFLKVVHRARHDRPFAIVELELQAEVDKYVASLLIAQRAPSLPSDQLTGRLYDGYRLLDGLTVEEESRYVRATSLARRYTRGLERRYVRKRKLPAMVHELRHFYRADLASKQHLIARAA